MRFRTTDFPSARGVVKPTRGPPGSSGCLRQNAAKNGQEIRTPLSYIFRKALGRKTRSAFGKALLCVPEGPFVTHCELVTAAGAAAGKHCPSVLALHASAKAVRLRTPAVVRLKRSLWHPVSLTPRVIPRGRTTGELAGRKPELPV